MAVSLNSSGSAHAGSLVAAGKVSKDGSWFAPSADSENSYIKNNGMASYGKWFLGADSSMPTTDKGHFKYPFSSNFSSVSLSGLKAIRQRAAQQGATAIFDRAGELINQIEPPKKAKAKVEIKASRRHGMTVEVTYE